MAEQWGDLDVDAMPARDSYWAGVKADIAARPQPRISNDMPTDQASCLGNDQLRRTSSPPIDMPQQPLPAWMPTDLRYTRSLGSVEACQLLLFKNASLPASFMGPDWMYNSAAYQSMPDGGQCGDAAAMMEALDQRMREEERDLALSISRLPLMGCDAPPYSLLAAIGAL